MSKSEIATFSPTMQSITRHRKVCFWYASRRTKKQATNTISTLRSSASFSKHPSLPPACRVFQLFIRVRSQPLGLTFHRTSPTPQQSVCATGQLIRKLASSTPWANSRDMEPSYPNKSWPPYWTREAQSSHHCGLRHLGRHSCRSILTFLVGLNSNNTLDASLTD